MSRVFGDDHHKRMPCHNRWGMQKNHYCSIAISAEHRWKFVALHRKWWRLHMIEKFSNGTINHKQTNKQSKSGSFAAHHWQWLGFYISNILERRLTIYSEWIWWCIHFQRKISSSHYCWDYWYQELMIFNAELN